ncbi:MAG TPA: hypothetical protein VLZ77_17090 [Acidimicrobiales bacterium]|nr:hypothetical protein [Acidimicrobiales bacterium]
MRGRGALVLAAGVVLVACGSPYPGRTLGDQVRSWASTTGWSGSLATLRADARHVRTLETGHDPRALRTACDALVDDALSANQELPAPDGALTAILSGAYASAAAAGRDCLAGAGGRAALLARAGHELDQAGSGYVKAQARMDDLSSPGAAS